MMFLTDEKSYVARPLVPPQLNTAWEITQCTWAAIANRVRSLNPNFAKILDLYSQDHPEACYLVKYPFGQKILEAGELQIPAHSGKFLPLTHPDQSKNIKKNLSYITGMPIGLVLDHTLEMFLSINQRETPFSIMEPGKIFGLWAWLNPSLSCERGNMWHITSGARSIFMLPKLTDSASHKKLQRFCGIHESAPTQLSDQWKVFTALFNQHAHRENYQWSSELLFFSEDWIQQQNEELWRHLKLFLYQCAWDATAFWRNQFIYDLEFYHALENNNLKPDPYIIDTSRHTLAISTGIQTGFGVALDDHAAPISFLQKIYLEIYDLPYAPTFMQPTYIHNQQQQPIYYSLQTPTLGSASPKARKLASKKYNLKELKYVLNKVLKTLSYNTFELQNSPVSLFNITKNLNIRYFHTEEDPLDGIEHAAKIVNTDPLLQAHLTHYPEYPFCDTSLFLCGVIQLDKNKK